MMRDLKYISAYLLPISALLGIAWLGTWTWATVILTFVILPIVELFTPESTQNFSVEQEEKRSKRFIFNWLLYLNAPLLFGVVGCYLWTITRVDLPFWQMAGLTLSSGIVAGANGINVAHELGHRVRKSEQWLAQLMLIPTLYQHFFIEHNRGHHKNIATDADPASARLGEHLFGFWRRSIADGWVSAWALERERLAKKGQSSFCWENAMWRYVVFQGAWLVLVGFVFGLNGVLAAILVALVGVLLLESINYIEHYGLRRTVLPSGLPEPVSPRHSWNSNHELGRIFLYELTRHSDHHYKSTRKYQVLRHLEESPQMPFGYPTSIVLALVPPLWFKVMNKRVSG